MPINIWVLTLLIFAGLTAISLLSITIIIKKKHISIKDVVKFSGSRIRLKKAGAFLLIASCIFGLFYASSAVSNHILFLESVSGTAEWRTSNGQKYLYVSAGGPYELGYLTGKMLANQINSMKLVLMVTGIAEGYTYSTLLRVARGYLPYLPQDHIDELQGMANGASAYGGWYISFDDILAQHVFTEAIYGRIVPKTPAIAGCTAFAYNNSESSVVFGQNFDFSGIYKPTFVWVLAEQPGKATTFTLRAGGCMCAILGKNEYNVSILSTLVQVKQQANYTMPLASLTKLGLETVHNVEECYDLVYQTTNNSYGYTLIIGNETTFIATQNHPSGVYRNSERSVVYSNTFTAPGWDEFELDPGYSVDRQIYAEGKLEAATLDGVFTNEELLGILSDAPIIARSSWIVFFSQTCAYFTGESFGLGAVKSQVGICPI